MNRFSKILRRTICLFGLCLLVAAGSETGCKSSEASRIMSVTGPIAAASLGATLPHEHIMVDFVGAERVSRERYDSEQVFAAVLPYLQALSNSGCKALFECTPAYLGRDARMLRRLSLASGVTLITNTGYYGAANDIAVPDFAYRETASQLAARWLKEWREGIDGTDIRPGFIKIAVDDGPLSPIDRKLVEAAVLTHLGSGLTIASHTGNQAAGEEQLEILQKAGVHPSAWIWVHAVREGTSAEAVIRAARLGAWVEFDKIGLGDDSGVIQRLLEMKREHLLGQVLLSQDAGWYHVGEPNGGSFRPYDYFFKTFVPQLMKADITQQEITLLTVTNPAHAFSIGVRR